jgi:hypothetical protein
MEAVCAYGRSGGSQDVDRTAIPAALDYYLRRREPHLEEVAKGGELSMMMLLIARQQGELQRHESPHWHDIARYRLLCDPLAESEPVKRLHTKLGLDLTQWLMITYMLYVHAKGPGYYRWIVSRRQLEETLSRVTSKRGQASALSTLGRTVEEIGEDYLKERRKIERPQLRYQARCGFIRRPLVCCPNGSVLIPKPSLLINNLIPGAVRLLQQYSPHDEVSRLLGSSLERAVGRLLELLPDPVQVLPERAYGKCIDGPRCDFVCELPDSILLVECKRTEYRRRITLPSTLRSDTSSGELGSAEAQIQNTSYAVRTGTLKLSESADGKPHLGLIVVLTPIELVNSPWYREFAVTPHAERAASKSPYGEHDPYATVEVFTFEALELLIALSRSCGMAVCEIIDEKLRRGYNATGEWDHYLHREAARLDGSAVLDELVVLGKEVWDDLTARCS